MGETHEALAIDLTQVLRWMANITKVMFTDDRFFFCTEWAGTNNIVTYYCWAILEVLISSGKTIFPRSEIG